MTRFTLLILFVALSACAETQIAPGAMPSNTSADQHDGSTPFSADPSQKMMLSEWSALVQEIKSLPGAIVDDSGPMLMSVSVGAPTEFSFYLFTQPAHPAHPAYIQAFPSTFGSGTTMVFGYAGSQSEFEVFVRAFLEHLRRSR